MFVTLRDGLSSLVEAIAARLPAGAVRLNTPVDADRTLRRRVAGVDGSGMMNAEWRMRMSSQIHHPSSLILHHSTP